MRTRTRNLRTWCGSAACTLPGAGGSESAEKTIRYITKYIAKDITDAVAPGSRAQEDHLARLAAELQTLPCSPTCANWLLYGCSPRTRRLRRGRDGARQGASAAHPRVHRAAVLVSRQWSNKTLSDHRADRKAWVKALLALSATGETTIGEHDQAAGDPPPFEYELASRDDPDVPPPHVHFLRKIAERQAWRHTRRARNNRHSSSFWQRKPLRHLGRIAVSTGRGSARTCLD
ncbi:replication initiator [Actinocatenispora sera]|uniref:Uncharacterized protein n=1 Tax=Actinocatenispora sera TaxID=390989 RepID=A0A810L2I7_9ACTN|nr:replication initiator [Actinocatenispora sera]BCJ29664.1 hypothetical protein Asera_37720 [Actinocatenispora sera]